MRNKVPWDSKAPALQQHVGQQLYIPHKLSYLLKPYLFSWQCGKQLENRLRNLTGPTFKRWIIHLYLSIVYLHFPVSLFQLRVPPDWRLSCFVVIGHIIAWCFPSASGMSKSKHSTDFQILPALEKTIRGDCYLISNSREVRLDWDRLI